MGSEHDFKIPFDRRERIDTLARPFWDREGRTKWAQRSWLN